MFADHGYTVVPAVFSPTTVQHLRRQFLSFGAHHPPFVDSTLQYPVLTRAITDTPLRDRLEELLGQHYLIPPYSSVDLNRYVGFHTDTTGIEIDGATFHRHPHFCVVTVAIYLQDGGMQVVPGSHRETHDPYLHLRQAKHEARARLQRSRLRRWVHRLSGGWLYDVNRPFASHPNAVTIPLRAGDALIFDLRLIHAAGPTPRGDKVGIFWKVGADHWTTRAYADHLKQAPVNDYLQTPQRAELVCLLNATHLHVEFL